MSAPSSFHPVAIDPARDAVFLDFDGTLVGFAERPEAVVVDDALRTLLAALFDACDGALAIVSGRQIETLDDLLAPLLLPTVGLHGIEWRGLPRQAVVRADVADIVPPRLVAACREFGALHPGVIVEEKSLAVALHYRSAREHANAVAAFVDDLRPGLSADWLVQRGHDVFEFRPAGADKGSGMRTLLAGVPFDGRRPLFVGDDRTDESGFALVNARGGVSVKVGPGTTCARYRLDDYRAVRAWLGDALSMEYTA